MKRGRPLARRTRLAPRSAKAVEGDRQLAESRRIVERRSGGWCEANTPACRPGRHRADHVHHVKSRARGGDHEPANLVHLCAAAHTFAHEHPLEAESLGLIVRSWT